MPGTRVALFPLNTGMKRPGYLICICLYVTLGAAACASSPTSPSGSTTVTTATPSSPANGAQIANLAQPVTLTVNNAVVTDAAAGVVYTFEVATDAGFATKVQTKDVPQSAGQTSLKLDLLAAGRDYYWHVRTNSGDTVGTFTSPLKFTIGPAIVIAAPVPVSPANGATTSVWPTLTVFNAVHSGPVGSITYKFELSTSETFNSTLVTTLVAEGSTQTSFPIPSGLSTPPQMTQYFWRVTATDQSSGISGPTSTVQSFTFNPLRTAQEKLAAQQGLVLWPGVQPTGTNGHSALGDNWQVQTLVSFDGEPFKSPPLDALQIFDLMDRGMSPQQAIDWRASHGYQPAGAYYPVAAGVIGFDFIYLALDSATGAWDLILRSE